MWITCLDTVSANSEKCIGSQWAVRVGQRLQSRFEKSGAARKLGLVQQLVSGWRCHCVLRDYREWLPIRTAGYKLYILETMTSSWHSRNYSTPFGWAATFSGLLMSLRQAQDMSLGRWLLVACFSSVKNHNVSGPHLFPSFTTHDKKSLGHTQGGPTRAKKSLCNRSQFRTLFLQHRFIKIRPSHQQPVSTEFLTICRIPEFPKSEQNRKSCGNVRILLKRGSVRRKNHGNLNMSFGMKILLVQRFIKPRRFETVRFFLIWPDSAAKLVVNRVWPKMRGHIEGTGMARLLGESCADKKWGVISEKKITEIEK